MTVTDLDGGIVLYFNFVGPTMRPVPSYTNDVDTGWYTMSSTGETAFVFRGHAIDEVSIVLGAMGGMSFAIILLVAALIAMRGLAR